MVAMHVGMVTIMEDVNILTSCYAFDRSIGMLLMLKPMIIYPRSFDTGASRLIRKNYSVNALQKV